MYKTGVVTKIVTDSCEETYATFEVKTSDNALRYISAFKNQVDVSKIEIDTKVQIIDLEDKGIWISGIMVE